MSTKMKQFIRDNIILIFAFLTLFLIVTGVIYYLALNPSNKSINEIINEIINKYKTDDYSIPYYIAERYLVWNNMRTFFFALNYVLTLLSIFASLMTIFYASNISKDEKVGYNDDKKNKYIVFLSLLSMCFTISGIFINPKSMANIAQHAWRELDLCIMQTVSDNNLSPEDKNRIIISKVVEMEKYVESYEH